MKLFFSPNGRIGRADYWLCTGAIYLLVYIMHLSLTPSLGRLTSLWILAAASLYPLICICLKRLHDLDVPAFPRIWIYVGTPHLCTVLLQLGIGYETPVDESFKVISFPDLLGWTLGTCIAVVGLVAAFECGFTRGTYRETRHGLDPRATLHPDDIDKL